jgi:hypothetical protein
MRTHVLGMQAARHALTSRRSQHPQSAQTEGGSVLATSRARHELAVGSSARGGEALALPHWQSLRAHAHT